MAARIDKYDPRVGGFRARLEAAVSAGQVGTVLGVTINSSGRVAVLDTDAAADVRGVIVPTEAMAAGDPVDVMTSGEIVEASLATPLVATADPGALVYVDVSDGTLTLTATDNRLLGHLVEAGRLVVRL
jgi:hypothetical protein